MPIPFLNSINLTKNQVENFCIYNVANDPTGSLTVAGDYGYFWLNTTNSGGTIPTLKWWDGTNVRSLVDSTNIGSFTSGLATDLAGGGAGQIVYQDGANDTKFLAAGTAGQVLSSNAASAPSWVNQSSLAAGTAANISGGLAGQLLYQSALATTAKLTIGTAGQALVVNAGATAPEWVDQSTFSVGSATNKPGGNVGDILVQSGSGTTGFLNVGTTGQVITSNGASPQYVNQSTLSVGSATTSGTATNIAGGAANRIPYQTAAGTTAFITDAANAILTTNASSVPALTAATNVTVGKAVDIALGAAGDLLYQSASNDTSFLNIGANGSILTSTGTAPQWSASIPSGSVSGLAASATTDTTDAGNISSGTLGLARLSLATGQFYVGDASNNPAATLKSSIPLSGFGAAGADVAMGGFKITGLANPADGTDAANKDYVDSVAQGLDVKASCKVGTIANITLSGPGASIDGISLSVDDRVLVKDQTDKKENGIYLWKGAALAMVRSADADTVAKLTSAFTFVEQGTNADSGWVCTVNSGTIGSVDIEWEKFSQAGSYTQGRGMVLDGTAFNFAQSTNYTADTIPYASGANTIGFIGAGTADQVLRVPGAGGTPAFGAIDLTKSAAVTGALPAANGGTGQSSYAVGDILFADSATSLAKLADVATGNALISGGVTTAPSWGKIGLTTHVSGTLPVGNGGTGATTFTAGQVLYGNGTSALSSSANLFWDNGNNRLGIGTATPDATVSIKQTGAQMDVSTSATNVTFECIDRAATTNAINTRWYTRNGEFQWNNSSYSRAMTLDSSGRLGIGTATPGLRLDVVGFGRFQSTTGSSQVVLSNDGGLLNFAIDSSTGGNFGEAYSKNIYCTGAQPLRFWTNGVDRMRIDSSGNVGIGTATPAYPLDISASKAVSRLTSSTGTNGAFSFFSNTGGAFYIGLDNSAGTEFSAAYSGAIWHSGAYPIVFATSNAEKMRLDSSGNLGIGTTTQNSFVGNLKVAIGTGSGVAGLTLYGGNATFSGLYFADGTTGNETYRGYLEYDHATDSFAVGTAGANKMFLTSVGNLGLGVTPSAGVKLQLPNGELAGWAGTSGYLVSNTYYGSGDFRYVGTGAAARYQQVSGAHAWLTAPSGTAGNAISFTQAMTLDASGNLLVGTVTPLGVITAYSAVGTLPTIGDSGSTNIATVSGASLTGTTAVSGQYATTLVVQSNTDSFAAGTGASIGFQAKWASSMYSSAAQFASIFGGKENGTDSNLAGYFSIATRPAGGNPTERLRIKSTGQVNFVGLASDPAGAAGDVVYNSTSNRLKYHNGTAWVNTGTNKYSGALTGTGTSFTVTHNLGTRDVTVAVRKSGSTYDQVFTDVQMTDTNTVTIVFASSVTGSDYTVTVIG